MSYYLKIYKTGLLLILTLNVSLAANATHPEKVITKAEKMALKNFKDMEILKEPVDISLSDHYKVKTDTVFRLIQKKGELMGYLVISSAMGRFEEFDFMMVYNEDLILSDLNILVYRSEYGYQVSTRGWLRQFLDHPVGTVHTYGQSIDAVSGATFSGKSLTENINRLNMLISTLGK
jgi:hypothetical protein